MTSKQEDFALEVADKVIEICDTNGFILETIGVIANEISKRISQRKEFYDANNHEQKKMIEEILDQLIHWFVISVMLKIRYVRNEQA